MAASVRFCPDCSNMLYPREDSAEKKLLFACRNCEYQEEVPSDNPLNYCIFRHQIQHVASDEQTQIIADVASDPTLPRTKSYPCPKCKGRDAVFFQSRARRADTTMTLYYVCCLCSNRWIDPAGMQ